MDKKEAEKTVKEFISVLNTDKGIEFEKEIEALKTLTQKKKLNTLDKYVIFSLAVLVIYTISALIVFGLVGLESKTLTICVFTAFSGEVVQCYFIKRFKLHEEMKIVGKKETNSDGDEA
jgi:hypothetical protein